MSGFYGRENVGPEIIKLYDDLKKYCWCADSCAERMRGDWSEENPTLGQCSITSFLVQDIYGGKVFGIPLAGGGVHCYNVVNGMRFDLTSEQFGEKAAELVYDDSLEQHREEHFLDPDKKRRYEVLCEKYRRLKE